MLPDPQPELECGGPPRSDKDGARLLEQWLEGYRASPNPSRTSISLPRRSELSPRTQPKGDPMRIPETDPRIRHGTSCSEIEARQVRSSNISDRDRALGGSPELVRPPDRARSPYRAVAVSTQRSGGRPSEAPYEPLRPILRQVYVNQSRRLSDPDRADRNVRLQSSKHARLKGRGRPVALPASVYAGHSRAEDRPARVLSATNLYREGQGD